MLKHKHSRYYNFEKNRKLFGDRTFVSQSAEGQSDKERKYRNDDLGHNRKYDLLEFIKKTCNKFCLVPGSCKSYHDGENKCTHYRHDLRNRELKYNFRKFLQSVYVCNDRKVWNQCIAGSNREQSCTDGRNIGDNKSFLPGEGIIKDDIEETIKSMGYIGRVGMRSTDTEILNVMIDRADINQGC